MKGGRKLSAWNLFVKKVYSEGKKSNKNYSFKQALTDASRRKGEMKNMSNKNMGDMMMSKKHMSRKTRRNRTHRRH